MSSPQRSDAGSASQTQAQQQQQSSQARDGSQAEAASGSQREIAAAAALASASQSQSQSQRAQQRNEIPADAMLVEDLDRDGDSSEGSGEELLDEQLMMDDYKENEVLDRYESDGLADSDDEDVNQSDDSDARMEAERQMLRRDAETRRRTGAEPQALMESSEVDGSDARLPSRPRRRINSDGDYSEDVSERAEAGAQSTAGLESSQLDPHIDLTKQSGPLVEFLALDSVCVEIKRRFREFLITFTTPSSRGNKNTTQQQASTENAAASTTGGGSHKYINAIHTMCNANSCSLHVSFQDMARTPAITILTQWVCEQPQRIFELLSEAAHQVVVQLQPNYNDIHQQTFVRLLDFPVVYSLREMRARDINLLIKLEGVVTRRSGVYPQICQAVFTCMKCAASIGPLEQQVNRDVRPGQCPECETRGPFTLDQSRSVYRNYQKIAIQETPGSVPAGRVPRTKDVILLHDLIDSVTPGELVEITGIYTNDYDYMLNLRNGFPVFSTVIKANYVARADQGGSGLSSTQLTDEDQREIQELSHRPDIAQLIFNSIAPSIYGHDNIKTALALAMFGGQAKEFANGHRIRGDINLLILGDPGTAKSQFLKYVEKTAARAVYATGKGASAVGLTASVHKDPLTREWVLEGGALVLADRGTCLIDEFDKMNDQDRTSIHEAMEQQTISISKAGIITTLKARCAVIAAANPVGGRYNSAASFADNVELTDAILSRFDMLCVVRDLIDVEQDARLAEFVVSSHCSAHPTAVAQRQAQEERAKHLAESQQDSTTTQRNNRSQDKNSSSITYRNELNQQECIHQPLLKKYMQYARSHCTPALSHMDDSKIASLYAELRRESLLTGGIPIAVRHIESMIRMSEAHARMHLRSHVNEDDVNMAIRCMLESFISTQKFSVMRSLRKHFERYLVYAKDAHQLLLFVLQQQMNESLQFKLLRCKDQRALQAQQRRQAATSGDSSPASVSDQDDLDDEAEVEAAVLREPLLVQLDEFTSKAAELGVTGAALEKFYSSPVFTQQRYRVDKRNKRIVREVAQDVLQQRDDLANDAQEMEVGDEFMQA